MPWPNWHPHVHCVVPAGGLSPDHQRWVPPKYAGSFLPVKVLSRVFRGKYVEALRRAPDRDELDLGIGLLLGTAGNSDCSGCSSAAAPLLGGAFGAGIGFLADAAVGLERVYRAPASRRPVPGRIATATRKG